MAKEDKIITIAGQVIPMRSWAVAKQLAAALENNTELSLLHKFALVYHAGVSQNERDNAYGVPVAARLVSLQQELDKLSDEIRNIARSLSK